MIKSIQTFLNFLSLSHQELIGQFRDYRLSMLGFFIINLGVIINWQSDFFSKIAFLETAISFIVILFNMYLMVNVLMIDKSKFLKKKKIGAIYNFPSFVIYTLYTGLIVLVIPFLIIGLDRGLGFNSIFSMSAAVILGVLVSVIVSMCPIASVLIDNDEENYFKVSLRLARNYFIILFFYTILTLLSEAPDFIFMFVENTNYRPFLGVLYALWDSYIFILVAKVGVKIFYGLYRNNSKVSLLE